MGAAAYAYKPQLGSTITRRETRSRRKRRHRVKIIGSARKLFYCIIPLVVVLLYVGLMAGLTAQTYKLAVEQHAHTRLLQQNNALRSRVAQLESVDRLQAVARRLHMSEPNRVALLSFPRRVQSADHTVWLLARIVSVTRWLGVR